MTAEMETAIRLSAFDWLKEQQMIYGETLPRRLLEGGFPYQGEHVTLVGASGIWKPRQLASVPISITTTTRSSYDDGFDSDGLLIYRYRGRDPSHRDNRGLQEAAQTRTPLVYFHATIPGWYVPVWPVFIIRNHPERLYCVAAVDPAYATTSELPRFARDYETPDEDSLLGVRKYVMAYTKQRLHQSEFRERVLSAYDEHCALCALAHRGLLDAAHIIPDSEAGGDPVVPNGLSLCKIHHAAYDQNILGVSPDFKIRVRDDILREHDGPMLRYGLQRFHGGELILPRNKSDWPDRDRLDARYRRFLQAS